MSCDYFLHECIHVHGRGTENGGQFARAVEERGGDVLPVLPSLSRPKPKNRCEEKDTQTDCFCVPGIQLKEFSTSRRRRVRNVSLGGLQEQKVQWGGQLRRKAIKMYIGFQSLERNFRLGGGGRLG